MGKRRGLYERAAGRGGVKPWLRRSSGQSIVELAIASFVLLLLMTGLLDLGRVFYSTVALREAAREGARHGSWFNSPSKRNVYLGDAEIKLSVDRSLAGAGLPQSVLQGGCPGNNPSYNPPYPASAYPPVNMTNVPWLYICYDTETGVGANPGTPRLPPPAGNTSNVGKDMEVVVLMRYGLITGFLQNQIGNAFMMAAHVHIRIQGFV
jgi:hypothetical protein